LWVEQYIYKNRAHLMEANTIYLRAISIKEVTQKKKIFGTSNSKVVDVEVTSSPVDQPSEIFQVSVSQTSINKLISEIKKEIYNVNLPISNFSITSSTALQEIKSLFECISSTPKIQRSLSLNKFIESENNLSQSSTFMYDFIKDSSISGVLTKTKNKNKRTKKERLCSIKYDRILYYFSVNDKRCKGLKFLDEASIISRGETFFQLKVGPNESYTFTTATAQECDAWVEALDKCAETIKKSKIKVNGQIQGSIIKARNLSAKDMNGLSDPYAIAKIEQQQIRTQTIYKSLNPTWNESFSFDITKNDGYFSLLVWDEDKFKTADFMGKILIPLHSLPANEEYTMWLPLAPRSSKDKVSGDVLLRLKYFYAPDEAEQSANSIYGQPLETLKTRQDICTNSIPTVLSQFISFFEQYGLKEEGIFRICGNSIEIKSIKNQINTNPNNIQFNPQSLHAFAGAFKLFFRELPDPLLTFDQYENLLSKTKNLEIQPIIEIIKSLPSSHIALLKLILPFFNKVAENSKYNMMNNSNLSIVFGPSFLRPRVETPKTLLEMIVVNELTKFIFENSSTILKQI